MNLYKAVYGIAIVLCCLAMAVMNHRIKKRKLNIIPSLSKLIIAAIFTVMFGMLSLLVSDDSLAVDIQVIHTMATEWILIFLFEFLAEYTGLSITNKWILKVLYVLSSIDMIIFFPNHWLHHCMDATHITTSTGVYTEFIEKAPWCPIHQYYSYGLALLSMIWLIRAIIKAPRLYRSKYYPAAIAFAITLMLEVACDIWGMMLDFTLFTYCVLVAFYTYHSVYHTFRGLITSTLSKIVITMENGVICFDMNDKCIYVNDIAKSMFFETDKLADFEDILHSYIGDVSFKDAEEFEKTVSFKNIDGDMRSYDITFSKLFDEQGAYIGCYLYCDDRTQAILDFNEANYKATHDMLTGLCNKELFEQRVNAVLSSCDFNDFYMITADIKDFKLINDIFGTDKGDEVLVTVARVITQVFSNKAIACRTNSDRFGFFVAKDYFSEDILYNAVKSIAEQTLSDNFQFIMHFGIYKIGMDPHLKEVSVMYDRSRMALQSIKGNYQKCIAYYDESMMSNIVKEREYVGLFDTALDNNQFIMYLQPQIVPETGLMAGAEALVRWVHPEHGMISPGIFIPIFENTGLIYKLDLYMWEQAAKTLVKWKEMGYPQYYISVNISPTDFYHLDIYKTFVDIVTRYDIEPNRLKLEITESSFMRDPDAQLALINKLQAYGFHVEIDDFGSGYSSLNMLKDMKADVLKIDMGFLKETESADRTRIILATIVELAKKLDMVIVVEGVETSVQVDYLTTIGCDLFQGYYFDKPIDIETFESKYFK